MIKAVLLDRDGTMIVNVPHNADPALVVPMPTAVEAVALLRRHGVPTAVVSNQSVIGRGWATRAQVDATNVRVEELLGPIGPFFICPHAPDADCDCRKPRPGLLLQAASALGVPIEQVVLIGDMGSDLGAAAAAGAHGLLVPTAETPPDVVAEAPWSAPTLLAAVEQILS